MSYDPGFQRPRTDTTALPAISRPLEGSKLAGDVFANANKMANSGGPITDKVWRGPVDTGGYSTPDAHFAWTGQYLYDRKPSYSGGGIDIQPAAALGGVGPVQPRLQADIGMSHATGNQLKNIPL